MGLLGLAALDVVLVGMALRSTNTGAAGPSPVSRARPSIVSSSVPVSPSSTTSGTATKAPLQTMLVAVDNKRAWRVGAGSCSSGGATLATTTDGGRTWVEVKVQLRRIVRVRPSSSRDAFVIGANSRCAAEFKDTSDGGVTWGSGDYVGGAWFRDPKNPRVVRAPGSSTSQPCGKRAVLDLAVLSKGSARVLCVDGLIRSTTDTGSSWTDAGKVTGAVALAVPSADRAETYVARLDAPDCAGVQIRRLHQRAATSCIRAAVPKDPGRIALSLVKGGGWLAIGDTTMRASGDLVTWRAS